MKRLLGLSLRVQVAAACAVVVFLISLFVGLYYPAVSAREEVAAKAGVVAGTAEMVALSVGVGLQLEEPSAVAAAFAWARRDSALRYVAVLDRKGSRIVAYDPDRLGVDDARERAVRRVHEWNGHFVVSAPIRFQDQVLGDVVLASSLAPIRAKAAAKVAPCFGRISGHHAGSEPEPQRSNGTIHARRRTDCPPA